MHNKYKTIREEKKQHDIQGGPKKVSHCQIIKKSY